MANKISNMLYEISHVEINKISYIRYLIQDIRYLIQDISYILIQIYISDILYPILDV